MGKVVGGVVGAVGSYYGAKRAADAARDAAVRQQQAAEYAREAAKFRPVGMTTRFGTSTFTTDPSTGAVTAAGYQATPEMQAIQDQIAGLYGGSLGQAERAAALQPQYEQAAQGLFGLGQGYLAQTPEEARQQYMSEQMAALRPYDIEEEQRLASSVFGRGRGGLSVGAGGQPELQALSEARSRRNLQLAAQADQAAQQRASFGAGLLGTAAQTQGMGYGLQTAALAPFQQQMALQQGLESAAQQPLQLGLGIGETASAAGARAGGLYQQGMGAANQYYMTQGGLRGGALAGLGQGLGSAMGGMSNPFSGLFGSGSNPMNIGLAGGGTFTQGSTLGPMTGGYSFYKPR